MCLICFVTADWWGWDVNSLGCFGVAFLVVVACSCGCVCVGAVSVCWLLVFMVGGKALLFVVF